MSRIHATIRAIALTNPQGIAVISGNEQLSYQALAQQSEALAAELLVMGVGPGTRVAVLLDRSTALMVALLAVIKSGAAYLPLDPSYPSTRIQSVLADADVAAVITRHSISLPLSSTSTPVLYVDTPRPLATALMPERGSETDPFYLIYTSGSTGMPKGAILPEIGVRNLYEHTAKVHQTGVESRYLVVSSVGFDLTQKNLWVPLMAGGTVVMHPQALFDAGQILEAIATHRITHLNCTPSAFYALIDGATAAEFALMASLRVVQLGGEAVDTGRLAAWWHNPQNRATLINGYGPTECSAVVAMHVLAHDSTLPQRLPIGSAVPQIQLMVVDSALQPCADGEEGELLVAGIGVGAGYLNRPELTARAFITLPGIQGSVYRTGDRVRRTNEGLLDYLGRADDQVKIGGHRIELGEVETVLGRLPGVRAAACAVHQQRLCAYLVAHGEQTMFDAIRKAAQAELPDALQPTHWQWLAALPLNPHGKVDRRALAAPSGERPAISAVFIAPQGPLETLLAQMWQGLLAINRVGRDDPFFEIGGSSLLALQFVGDLSRSLGERLRIAPFFAASTIRGYASSLSQHYAHVIQSRLGITVNTPSAAEQPRTARTRAPTENAEIAIIGMALRVPGAADVNTFWANLRDGVESIRPLTDAELQAAGISDDLRNDPDYVRMAPVLEHADCFDAAFFGYTAREAELMDPQQRLLHEVSWAALEDAGLAPNASPARVGVFAGVARNSYFTHNLATNSGTREQLGEVHLTFGNDKDYAATHVAHKLNLKGPAVSAQTACSTGGVLLHLARQSLLAGDCEVALVAGARVMSPLTAGHMWIDGSIFTRDGHMRVFDAEGSGMIRGSGVVCLVLKRLADAQTDGDRILAVVKGSAINNDGAEKAGYTAPSVTGQKEVISLAMADAKVSADSVSYLEAHGTATHLGDPIEMEALTQAYREHTSAVGYCRIGSVKSNIGHLDPAAALAGIAKTVLALQHQLIPPTLGFVTPNPQIDFAHSPFIVNAQATPWQEHAGTRRAGVSAFGIGGTNFHGIFEQAPTASSTPSNRRWQLLPLAAKTPQALSTLATRTGDSLAELDSAALADAAWTLQTGRAALSQRGFSVALSGKAAQARLHSTEHFYTGTAGTAQEVVFVFPGQGAQHPQMGAALYAHEPVFRAVIDEGAALLEPLLGLDIRTVLYPNPDTVETAAETLKQTGLAQPAIYLVSLATAKLWQSWGIQPTRLVGHSVGEYVAATLAEVFSFADALRVLATRARLMQTMPAGSMLAVRRPAAELLPMLPPEVSIAAINSPKLTIISGPSPALAQCAATLEQQGVATVPLHTSHAFHSAMMEPLLPEFTAVVASVPRKAPTLTIISTLTGMAMTAEQAISPEYWAQQLRQTVRFAPAMALAVDHAHCVVLEVGPGQSLSGPIKQSVGTKAAAVASLPAAASCEADAQEHMLSALGRLWMCGITPDWQAVHGQARLKRALPTYPFTRTRHWVEAAQLTPSTTPAQPVATSAEPSPVNTSQDAPVDVIGNRALAIIGEVTGQEFSSDDHSKTFLELGMDSLLLTQVAGKLKSAFKVDLRFRQLLEALNSIERLLAWLRERATAPVATAAANAGTDASAPDGAPKKAFGAAVRISREQDVLSPAQRHALNGLMARTVARTAKSKASAQKYRMSFADPRTVSGFKPMWKETVYPIVSTRSEGAYLWDVDGNRYIDTVNGFGSTIFGHKPPFVDAALKAQIDKGYEVGPVQDFLGELSEIFTRMVKLDRVAFCNTGSEAVSAAQRCARTVTGKDLIASFNGDYHGVHDEVIVRPGANGKGFPAASGIPNAHTSQALILDYGDPKSLDILRSRADELAAILIEPIQSRNQDLQPREFIHALREIATEAGCAFIMDEVITGFRIAPGGAQEFFGVKADIATYGKVFGGGMPVGAVAGIPKFMDALDGGFWSFGDDSVPEAGVTFFAGTFVRHPLAMAASLASLQHLEAHPELQNTLNQKVIAFVARLRTALAQLQAPVKVTTYTSIFRFEAAQEEPFFELLAHYFRLNGVHTYDHRNQIMTTAHTDEVMDALFVAYIDAVTQMQKDGLLGTLGAPVKMGLADSRPGSLYYAPPQHNARLGLDAHGNPQWYRIPDQHPETLVAIEDTL